MIFIKSAKYFDTKNIFEASLCDWNCEQSNHKSCFILIWNLWLQSYFWEWFFYVIEIKKYERLTSMFVTRNLVKTICPTIHKILTSVCILNEGEKKSFSFRWRTERRDERASERASEHKGGGSEVKSETVGGGVGAFAEPEMASGSFNAAKSFLFPESTLRVSSSLWDIG